jgi:hypothetical protein
MYARLSQKQAAIRKFESTTQNLLIGPMKILGRSISRYRFFLGLELHWTSRVLLDKFKLQAWSSVPEKETRFYGSSSKAFENTIRQFRA